VPKPTSENVELSRRSACAALARLSACRFPGDDTDEAPGRAAAVETLWWVRLLAEQLAYPGLANRS
jgi:hypothetical protein